MGQFPVCYIWQITNFDEVNHGTSWTIFCSKRLNCRRMLKYAVICVVLIWAYPFRVCVSQSSNHVFRKDCSLQWILEWNLRMSSIGHEPSSNVSLVKMDLAHYQRWLVEVAIATNAKYSELLASIQLRLDYSRSSSNQS